MRIAIWFCLAFVASTLSSAPAVGRQEGSAGTGFFVGANGKVVTSFHVIDGATAITVRTVSGRELPAKVEQISRATDLAVLRVGLRPTKYLSFSRPGSARSGDRVFTFGFPVTDLLGLEPKYSDGAVSAVSGIAGEAAFMQITVPVQPGNSGGPVVNERGEVVGVVAAQAAIEPFLRLAGTLPQNVNWAVRSEYAAVLVTEPNLPPATSRDAAVDRARESVVMVIAIKTASDVAAIDQTPARPSTSSDPAENTYNAGFVLWDQKKYVEAINTLAQVGLQWPRSRWASWANNLIGLSYLGLKKPVQAARVLLSNYQYNPKGERAADSLFFVGQALMDVGKPEAACKAYDELQDVYGRGLRDYLKQRLPAARAEARCL